MSCNLLDSDVDYCTVFSTESSTDEEFENEQAVLQRQIEHDEFMHYIWDYMQEIQFESPLNGPMDGAMLNACLYSNLTLNDVLHNNRLRYTNKVVLGSYITNERIDEFRFLAKLLAQVYNPVCSRFSSYINSVTAALIQYHFKL